MTKRRLPRRSRRLSRKLARQSTSAKRAFTAQGKFRPDQVACVSRVAFRTAALVPLEVDQAFWRAIRKCLCRMALMIHVCPCVAPVPTVSTASSDDFQAAAAAAAKRKAESDAAAAAKAAVKISPALVAKVEELFKKIDFDANGTITKDEAQRFWGKNWAKVNAQAMFNEVDKDENDEIDLRRVARVLAQCRRLRLSGGRRPGGAHRNHQPPILVGGLRRWPHDMRY